MLIKRKLIKSDIEFYRDVQDINDPCIGCRWYESVGVGYGYACNNYKIGQWKTLGEICREIYGKFDIDGCYSYFPENERK